MSVKLGWKVDLSVSVLADGAPQDVTLTVSRGARDDRLLAAWRTGMAELTNAVNHGMMSGPKISPTKSRMEVHDISMDDAGDIRTTFTIAGIDPGGWRTITALAVFFTYGSPSPAVRMVADPGNGKRPQVKQPKVWSLPYPSAPDKLPFKLEREEDPTSTEILLRIRFRAKLDAATKKAALGAIKSWAALLFGGYPDDGEDMTATGTSSNEAYLVDPRTVEYSADYRGHSAALDGALLMALWFHESGAAVESVLIE